MSKIEVNVKVVNDNPNADFDALLENAVSLANELKSRDKLNKEIIAKTSDEKILAIKEQLQPLADRLLSLEKHFGITEVKAYTYYCIDGCEFRSHCYEIHLREYNGNVNVYITAPTYLDRTPWTLLDKCKEDSTYSNSFVGEFGLITNWNEIGLYDVLDEKITSVLKSELNKIKAESDKIARTSERICND